MAYSKVKLKSVGVRASPYFKPFLTENLSDTFLPTRTLLYVPVGLIFINFTSFLTYSMVQSPSWEANWFAASHKTPRISRNTKLHYRNHKRPSPVSILGQPNPVHIHTFHFLEIYPNIIRPSTPRSPSGHQEPVNPPLLTHTRHMPSPSQSFNKTN